MALLAVELSENGRGRLGTLLWIINWASTICGVVITSMGIYFKIRVEEKMNLIDGYNANVLPWMLIVVGIFSTVVFLGGGKICHDCGNTHTRAKLKGLLLPYIIVLMVLVILLLAGGSMCFDHRRQLHDSLHDGLKKAMGEYRNDAHLKKEIDLLQMEYQCCGNEDHKDWFVIPWINGMYLNMRDEKVKEKMATGGYLNDDAPFSCCDPASKRPCIHHHVFDSDMHYNYDPNTGLTIYTDGCRRVMTEYFSHRLEVMGAIIMSIFGAQVLVLIGVRYLQTSIHNADVSGDPTSNAPGWLFENMPVNVVRAPKSVRDKGIIDEESKE
ncbi:photoreceptor outer segment membrane glycoprotein 2-like [Saccoglossus kowalevskii]